MSVARLSATFRARNKTSRNFREQYKRLPPRIRQLAREQARFFERSPNHPSLRLHELKDRKKSSHVPKSFSVAVTMGYRAIFFVDQEGTNVWYWIGSHAEYDRYIG